MTPPFDAIVLAGGRASRLGGTPKPGLLLDERPLLAHALDAVRDAEATAVVGPDDLEVPPGVRLTREDPPFGGPVAGIDAGLSALDREGAPDVVVLLAVDVPGAAAAIPTLATTLSTVWTPHLGPATPPAPRCAPAVSAQDDGERADAACLFRDDHRQTLVAAVRRASLLSALETLRREAGSVRDQSVRRLLAGLRVVDVPDDDGVSLDVDTWDDLARLQAARTGRTT